MQERDHKENHRKLNNTDDQDTICFELPESETARHEGYYQRRSAPSQPEGYYQRQSAPTQPEGYYQQQSAPSQPEGYYQRQSAPIQPEGYYQRQSAPTQPEGYYQRQSAPSQPEGYYQRQSAPTQPQGGYYQGQQAPPPPPQGGYSPPPYRSPRPPKKKLKKKGAPVRQNAPAPPPPVREVVVKKKKRRRKTLAGKIIRRVLLSLLSIFLILFGIYSCTSLTLINKMNLVSTGERTRTEDALSRKYVRSVLIIGTDGRSDTERGRSDSMILVSLNKKTNKLIMTSFMRDSLVNIPGYGDDKLNNAYSYGGPELLMDTIESNFKVKIDDYIQINFSTFASVIDAAGGIDMEISDAEAEALNVILISEVNELMGDERESDLIEHGGKLHLNGKQALSYSRIRSVGNYDFERTNRQRKVVTALIKKARKGGLSFLRKVGKGALPSITSNMSKWELYKLSLRIPFILKYDTEQLQIPADGTYSDDPNHPKGWVIIVDDFEENYHIMKDKIFSR